MRVVLDPKARRLLRLLPRTTVYSWLEIVLLSLLAVQCARLVWTVLTPVDPIGDWRARSDARPAGSGPSILSSFDPFFRLAPQTGPAVVTALNLQLFGVREDRASGRGAAIISTPDGQQRSFAVGEEIVPGVTLTGVAFDHVTITRNGAAEQLYMDQSGGAPAVGGQIAPMAPSGSTYVAPPPPSLAPPLVPVTPTAAPANLSTQIRFQPRMNGGELTGVTVQPNGAGEAFRAAGLAPGDVITSVNGQRLTSSAQAAGLASQVGGGQVRVQVERNGRVIPLTLGSRR